MKKIILLAFVFGLINIALATEGTKAENESVNSEEEFNASESILEHVKDAHEWHLWTTTDKETGEEHHVAIPLPVILVSKHGVDIFMSGKFHHNHVVNIDDRYYTLHNGKIYFTDKEGNIDIDENGKVLNSAPLDFSITKTVAGMLISAIIILLIFISVAKQYRKNPGRPKGLQSFMEPLILFIRDEIAIPNIGNKKYNKFLPYLITVFLFILCNNLLGLVPFFPGGANVTGNIAVTMTLAVMTLLITNFSGNKQYWKHIFAAPGVPVWLLPIMIPVEIIGVFTKPFALMVRLFANIAAGHIVVLSIVSLIFIFKSIYIAPASVIFVVFMDCIELLVAFLQAYIFTLLSALFIGMAVADHH